jgi:hypothetical protein
MLPQSYQPVGRVYSSADAVQNRAGHPFISFCGLCSNLVSQERQLIYNTLLFLFRQFLVVDNSLSELPQSFGKFCALGATLLYLLGIWQGADHASYL